MTIKEILTENDVIYTGIKMLNLSGIMQERQRKIRKSNIIRIMLGLLLVAVGILLLIQGKIEIIPQANIAFGCAYAFVALIWMIFAKRIDEFRIRKNIRNNRMVAGKKYNIPLSSIECITVIEDDYVETRELGSSTRYLKKDYLRNFEDDKFYILEFTNGRYLFFKKDSFPSKEDFDKLIEEIDKFDS